MDRGKVVQVGGSLMAIIASGLVIALLTGRLSKLYQVERLFTTKPPAISPSEYLKVGVTPKMVEEYLERYVPDMRNFIDRVLEHEEIIRNLRDQFKLLTELDKTTDIGAKTALILADVETLDARMKVLEENVMANPEKALSIPLMQKDIERIENSQEERFERIEGLQKERFEILAQNIDRAYGQTKWFIGLMFPMAIGLIGLAVSSFIQTRKKQ